ncbi:MAG TPA: peptidoglycan-associated lipoprotein Pal [Nitrospiria bacterium]|nr:peptidoglycan-associated lipoprotein Pal [Nitrospiria bacterium]
MIHARPFFFANFALFAALLVSACAHTTTAAKGDVSPARTETGPVASPAPSVPTPAASAQTVALPTRFQDAFFDFEKALIREDAKQSLQEDAKVLQTHRAMTVTIGGYCDERGTDEYNLVLGNRRAEAVKHYLAALGVDPGRLKTISYGKEKPFCTEHTEACYRQNRRGHIIGSADAP